MHVVHSVGFATAVGFGWFYLIFLHSFKQDLGGSRSDYVVMIVVVARDWARVCGVYVNSIHCKA